MSITIRINDSYHMRVGDKAVFINNVPMNPELNITTHKEYTGVITYVVPDRVASVKLIDDVGEEVNHDANYDSHCGGYATVYAVLTHDEFAKRVNEQYEKRMQEASDRYHEEEDRILKYADAALAQIGRKIE